MDREKQKRIRRSKEKKEGNKKNKKIKAIMVIMAVIVMGIIGYIANDYIILDKNKNINLVINNRNVTLNLKKPIMIEKEEIYISKQDIGNFFDKYIYEEKQNNQIVTTYDSKIAELSLENNKIRINGTNKDTYAHAIKREDTIYIPIQEMQEIYGIEIEYKAEAKVVAIDSIAREQKKAIIAKDVAVKSSTRIIAKTIDRVKKGSYVIVISDENGYAKIRTENGKIGYVKSNKIANTVVVRESIEKEEQNKEKINLVWDYFSTYAKAPNRTGEKMEGVNVVSPAFFHLDSNGELQENVGDKGQAYIEWAHSNGYKVWPMVQNAGEGMLTVTSEIMNDYNKRQKLIEEIFAVCVKYKLDGINIDFENMKQEDKNLFSRFIIELTPRLKSIGLNVSVDVTAPDGSETWSLCFDRHVIGDVADYIVFMAYDQYGASSNKSGTTAGYDWVKVSLKKFLDTEEIKSEKIILAIPLYTRLWTENINGEIVKQSPVSIKSIEKVIPKDLGKKWDDNLRQYYVEYTEGSNIKKMWIEDEKSLKEKISLVTEYNLGGVASWAKDMETENFWSFLQKCLTLK